MASYNVRIDLSKLNKVAVTDIQGRNGRVKCVVIPIEDNNIYVSDKTGNIYADFTAFEREQENYGQTHIIKVRVGGEKWHSMSAEERRQLPICGSMSPQKYGTDSGTYTQDAPQPSTSQSSSSFRHYNSNDSSNLPF